MVFNVLAIADGRLVDLVDRFLDRPHRAALVPVHQRIAVAMLEVRTSVAQIAQRVQVRRVRRRIGCRGCRPGERREGKQG
jgi:hypothetical protein